MDSLINKVALVTGGGGGLGEALCTQFAEAGMQVIAADVNKEQVNKVVNDIQTKGYKVEGIQLDVLNAEKIDEAVNKIVKHYGHLDVVVNNAGINLLKSILDLSVDEWDKILGVNLRAPFILSRAALKIMSKQQSGHIVNIASTAAVTFVGKDSSAYHASKAGVLAFTRALFMEARDFKVKVTAIVAGGMKTPFVMKFPWVNPDDLQDPLDVAKTIHYILSQPTDMLIPEVMVIPMRETSWP